MSNLFIHSNSLKRLLVCEDFPLVQMGLESALRQILPDCYLDIVGTGEDALQKMRENHFDLALFDLGLPDISGIELIQKAKKIKPNINIIIVTSCDQPALLTEVRKIGVCGIMQKASSLEHLNQAIEWVLQNPARIYLDPAVRRILQESSDINFTPKELEILKEIVKGLSNQQIADALTCSIYSIRFHRANILSKANVRSASELTSWYLLGQRQRN